MPSCSEYLIKCWWRGELNNCSDLFDIRQTDDGFCCSFNTLDQSQNLDISVVIPHKPSGLAELADWFQSIFLDQDIVEIQVPKNDSVEKKSYFPVDNDSNIFQDSLAVQSLNKGLDILTREKRDLLSLFSSNDDKRTTKYDLLKSNSASYLLGLTVLTDSKSGDYFVSAENYVGFKVRSDSIQIYS